MQTRREESSERATYGVAGTQDGKRKAAHEGRLILCVRMLNRSPAPASGRCGRSAPSARSRGSYRSRRAPGLTVCAASIIACRRVRHGVRGPGGVSGVSSGQAACKSRPPLSTVASCNFLISRPAGRRSASPRPQSFRSAGWQDPASPRCSSCCHAAATAVSPDCLPGCCGPS